MDNKQEVAAYVASLIEELVHMCRHAGLSDLGFLLAVTAAEAQRVRGPATEPAALGVVTH
jgi:hypothetical protein